jgi:glycosyltransferase involved in cell wall biosynthesis
MMSHGYPPTVSGVSILVQKVARAMVREGHEVTVVTASEHGKAYVGNDEGVNIARVRSRPNPFWSEGPIPIIRSKEADDLITRYKPDIIHTHDGALLSQQLLRRGERDGIPLVATSHYLPRFLTQYVNVGPGLKNSIINVAWEIAIRLLSQFDHVIFPSVTQQQAFLQHGLCVPTTVISNGVDTTRYNPLIGCAEANGLPYYLPPKPRIIFVGRLARDKKIEILIESMPHIWAEREAHLFLVGRGDDRRRLEKLTESLGMKQGVHFLGFVPEGLMPELYRRSDIFVIASTCEVQSIPTLQAVATGLPIVSANAGALPELVQDNVNGFLVPPDDPQAMGEAILRVLRDPELANRMGIASHNISRGHSETHTFEAYEGIYYSILDELKISERETAYRDALVG